MIATITAGITIFAKSGNGVGVVEEVIGVTEMVVVLTSTKSVVVSLAGRGISVVCVVDGVVDLWH